MNINENQQKIIDEIFNYFHGLNYENVIIYGSFVEQLNGFDLIPNDIDVVIIVDNEPPEIRHKTFYLNVGFPINVEFLHRSSFEKELDSMQPKYFLCLANDNIKTKINEVFMSKKLSEVRTCISAICSKAFDKGKKKLTVPEDYDKVLGLKNIFHAFKFIFYAKCFYYPELKNSGLDIVLLNYINKTIHDIYDNSTGTFNEKCDAVLKFAKGMYNSEMTGFRILFPKEVNK